MSETAVKLEPPSELSIRRAEAKDHAVVPRLSNLVHEIHAAQMPDVFLPVAAVEFSIEQFEACLNDQNLLLLAERNGEVVGALHAVLHRTGGETVYVPCQTMLIWYVVTEPSARRRGVARTLIAAAAEWAAENDAARIELAVWSFNAEALALYRALGFTPVYTGMTIKPSEVLARHGTGRLPERPVPGFLRRT